MRKPSFALLLLALAGACAGYAQTPATISVVRLDPALDELVPKGAALEKVAGDFIFTEGPVWVRQGRGSLLFSDIPANVIREWSPGGKMSVFLEHSGFTGADATDVGGEFDTGHGKVFLLGSNGLTVDSQGRVVLCAHGDRAIVRVEKDGKRTVLADRYEGKRLNSPNDLVFKSDGALYFSDPSAGLRQRDADPKKELPFQGVFLLKDGKLALLTRDMTLPNGLAFSPDEKYLYVDDTAKKNVTRYEVQPDDTISFGRVFADMSTDKAPGNPDGMKVDKKGNVYCTGPGGVWILSPEGKHLGTIVTPEVASNLAFGESNGMSLFITARSSVYRIRLKVPGIMASK